MKPNIFELATKELSQDAFITWLLKWADINNVNYDKELNKCGVDFITQLIQTEIPNFNEEILTVEAGRQWNDIDVWAKVNNKYLIIIEDKTFTGQHSGQLKKYKDFATNWCNKQTPEFLPPICIYLKTGNESLQSLNIVLSEGFKIYNRLNFLSLLENHNLSNEIFNDFKLRLQRLEKVNNEWENKLIKDWGGDDWQGFYQYLEKQIKLVAWRFVNNPNKGFWCAVLNWHHYDIYPIYLQTEQYKLCFKISTNPDDEVEMPNNVSRGEVRNRINNLILSSAKENGINSIRRPNRFGNGKYMTVAVVDGENWLGNKNDKIEKEKVVQRLLAYKSFLLKTIKQPTNMELETI